jgi:hypothetical protein
MVLNGETPLVLEQGRPSTGILAICQPPDNVEMAFKVTYLAGLHKRRPNGLSIGEHVALGAWQRDAGGRSGREGKFVLKYFLLREAVRRKRQGAAKAV